MSDSSNDQTAPSAGPHGGDQPDTHALSHVESPGIAPDSPDPIEAAAATSKIAAPETVTSAPKPPHEGAADRQPSHVETISANGHGTALILAPPRTKRAAPEPEPAPIKSAPRSRFGSVAAMAAAAVMGGLAGSLATAGVSYLTAPQEAAPSHYAALAEALGRVDHELTVLKSGVEGSTKTSQQVARIAERVDRAERAQADAGAKIAKATDAVDRMERRLAVASGDVTGTIADTHVAAAATLAPGPDMKRPMMGPILDGWVVRDVYNGSAMIQNRASIIQVLPGDNLPGLGRIEQVRRQDGRWVVVTSPICVHAIKTGRSAALWVKLRA
jgi:hypothetical protein